mmetsp:Transcript_19913/g.57719  ORF Transcript_19913/g.57719 Transcript_19913/m.57719 type:complete len:82 (-) Transcript_19913:14-259(-)
MAVVAEWHAKATRQEDETRRKRRRIRRRPRPPPPPPKTEGQATPPRLLDLRRDGGDGLRSRDGVLHPTDLDMVRMRGEMEL